MTLKVKKSILLLWSFQSSKLLLLSFFFSFQLPTVLIQPKTVKLKLDSYIAQISD